MIYLKKCYILLGLFVFIISYYRAQENIVDSSAYRGIIKEFNKLLNTNRSLALIAADKMENLSLKNNDLYFLSDANYKKALVFYYNNDFNRAKVYAGRAINDAKISENNTILLKATNLTGAIYYNFGDLRKSEYYYLEKIKIAKSINDTSQELNTYYNISLIYFQQGNYLKSVDYNFKALQYFQRVDDTINIITSLHSIGFTYMNLEDIPSAMKFYTKAAFYAKRVNENYELVGIYIDISTAYSLKSQFNMAYNYINMAIEISIKSKDDYHYTIALNNKSGYLIKQKKYTEALVLSKEAGELNLKANRKLALCEVYENTSNAFLGLNRLDSALIYVNRGYGIASDLKQTKSLYVYSGIISSIYEAKHNTDSAFKYFKLFFAFNDSLKKENQLRGIAQKEFLFEKQNQEQLRAKEKQFSDAKLQKQKQINFIIIFASILISVFLVIGIINYRQKQKANALVLLQKRVLEEKGRQITESLTYAKRLQEAILPPIDFINKSIQDFFILYCPKDIVAGDFYWAEKVNNLFFIAAADSTGHGVPGAMVSVVCSNALNRAVKEFKLIETGKILDKTREIVLETFEKSLSDVKDGMDISILCIDTKNNCAFWSGANNPLWYVQNGILHEIKANKQSICKTELPMPFTTHKIESVLHTTFYLFTDGYADQFGGPKGKKYKYKQLKDVLELAASSSVKDQHQILFEKFNEWKGILEQVDDVCVIGIKL